MIDSSTLALLACLAIMLLAVGVLVIRKEQDYQMIEEAIAGKSLKLRTTRTKYGTTRVLFSSLVVLEFSGEYPFDTDFTTMKPMHQYLLRYHPKGHIP